MNIIELAEQAGFERIKHTNEDWVCFSEEIEAFAALVEAHEREAAITAIQNIERKGGWITREDAIEAITARGTT
jgi:hypothetical protein